MALLFCDGFDHVDDPYELLKWDTYYNASAANYAAGYGRNGGWGILLGTIDTYYITKVFPSNVSTVIMGIAVKAPLGDPTDYFIDFREGGNAQSGIIIGSSGEIIAYRGSYSTVLGKSNPNVIPLSAWCYLEVKIVFHDSAGSIEVKVNGNQVLNLTSQDTINTANAYTTDLRIHGGAGGRYIDDLYICDTTGGINDDFLGDVKVTTLYPISDGNSSDFTPSTGVDNYATVDEPQLLGLTDYNESSTIGHKDLYGVTAYAGTGTIHAVQVNPAVLNTDTGTMNVRALSRSGGTPVDNEGSDFAISQTIKPASHIWEQEPTDVVAWTAAKINAAEFGLKIES